MPAVSVVSLPEEHVEEEDENDSLNKESCHDSGIDIRESSLPPVPPPLPNKKVCIPLGSVHAILFASADLIRLNCFRSTATQK